MPAYNVRFSLNQICIAIDDADDKFDAEQQAFEKVFDNLSIPYIFADAECDCEELEEEAVGVSCTDFEHIKPDSTERMARDIIDILTLNPKYTDRMCVDSVLLYLQERGYAVHPELEEQQKGKWFAVRHRAYDAVYWGPFESLEAGHRWAKEKNIDFGIGFVQMNIPDSPERTWW
jgi:hypothetical protein